MKVIDKDRKLPRSEYKDYLTWLKENVTVCQANTCFANVADYHHAQYGAYKNDRYLVGLCREHHEQAHKHKYVWIDTLMDLGHENWGKYAN